MANNDALTQVTLASGINVLLGALLITFPWLLSYASLESALMRNSVVVGAFIMICGALRVFWSRASAAWSGANIVFGFWTAISSWIYRFATSQSYMWSSVTVGVATILLAAWSGNVTLQARRDLQT